jgi:ABC-2 type transport system permease protein
MRFIPLAARNFKEMIRDPLSIGFEMGIPALFLVMFWALGVKTGGDIFTASMLVPAVAIFGFGFLTMFSALILARDRGSALLSRLLTAPLKSRDFILAYFLPFLLIAVIQIAVCFGTGALLGLQAFGNAYLVILVLFIMAACSISLGMFLGSVFNESQASGLGSAIIVLISLFGGLWMDLQAIGGVFKVVGYALPFAHAVDGARAVMRGAGFGDIIIDFYWIIGYTLLFFILGILCFRFKTTQ